MGNPTSDIDNISTEQLFQDMDDAKAQAEKQRMETERIAMRLARAKSWSLVRDLFIYEMTRADVSNVKWSELKIPVEEIGQRVVIMDEVYGHLKRILDTINGLVASGASRESGIAPEEIEKQRNEQK